MLISSTLACFHSSPPLPLLPTPRPLMTTEEGLNGPIPQRFFRGRRDVTDAIAVNVSLHGKSNSEARDKNRNVVSL